MEELADLYAKEKGVSITDIWNKAQAKIAINAHALSTNTPKYLSVRNATFAGCSALAIACFVFAHKLRRAAR